MKTYIYLSLLVFSLFCVSAQAQETENQLAEQKEAIISEEKEALKKEVEAINEQLDKNEITQDEAKTLKENAAEKRALNIDNRIAILENETALKERNASETGYENEQQYISIIGEGNILKINLKRERKYDRRTYSDFVFAFGFNNVITEGESFNDSQFKIGGSRFAELGWAWKTRVFQNSNLLRVKYGFSFQFNGLKPIDNQYFLRNGDVTELQEFPFDLRKSKFRMDNLVFPVHFEFGPSRKIEGDNYFRYSTRKQLKVGLGGYAGFNLGTRQKLRYSDDNGRVREKLKGSYNTNNFIYGLSGYIGWNTAALYVKYDLNPIFKNNPVNQRNISVGLRFDMD